jgi:UDP-GlcNAc:undecaprenyl-phosphate GlcNAc-1-phosphate transferase
MDLLTISFMFKGILFGLIACLGLGWIGIWAARRAGLIDIPGATPHKRHAAPTPLAGGITFALCLVILFFATGLWRERQILIVPIGGLIIFCFGLWDDKRSLSVPIKLLGQILGAVVVMSLGINIGILESPFDILKNINPMLLVWADRLLTLLWIVGVTNAFNLVDSMDGLAVGLSSFAFAFFMLASYGSQQFIISYFLAILLGISLGLVFYNSPPAKLFLGDSGAQTFGFILATMSILYNPLGAYQSSTWFIPILLLGVPIFDTCLVVFSRLRRHIPFYKAGNDHTYHRLVNLGMDSNHAVLAINFSALILNCLAFTAMTMKPLFANLLFLACLLMGLMILIFFEIKAEACNLSPTKKEEPI